MVALQVTPYGSITGYNSGENYGLHPRVALQVTTQGRTEPGNKVAQNDATTK